MGKGDGGIIPYLALVTSQVITSSWHVLGKHVMHQVPYLTPIAFVLIRTAVSAVMLLTLGRIYEGHVPIPPLFCDDELDRLIETNSLELIEVGVGLSVNGSSDKASTRKCHGKDKDAMKKRKRRRPSTWREQVGLLRKFISHKIQQKPTKATSPTINPEIIQIVSASIAGMILLPLCYTTGLILTNPTVASVWDGPMIPLGVFCTAVGLGAEKMSRTRPFGQVISLLLTVGGSIIVLLVDFLGAHNSIKDEDGEVVGHASHWQFIRGNILLMGITGTYAAMSLLQKQLTHFPPITLTGWMFASGFLGCCTLLLLDSALYGMRGATLTGCTMELAITQLSVALSTSPTFRFGMIYAALFVGSACFSIMNYASSHLDASIITLFAAIQPPITAVLEFIWEGKELGFKKIIGMVCVGIGMCSFTHIKKSDARPRRQKRSIQNREQYTNQTR